MPNVGSALRLFLVIASLLSGSTVLAAEERITLGVGIGQSNQSAGRSDRPYLGPGFGGTSLGAVIVVDFPLGSIGSIGLEASLADDITGEQDERVPQGSNHLLSRHHDTIVSGLWKGRASVSRRLQVAAGGGAGFARRQTTRTGTFGSITFGSTSVPLVTRPVTEELSDGVVALTGGVDGVFALNPRVGVLGLVRIHRLIDDDRLPDGVVQRGVSSWIARYGIGAQIRF